MTTLTENKNFLSPLNMTFSLQRAMNVRYTCQRANVPGINTSAVNIPNPFRAMPKTPDTLTFNEFTMSFLVNENLENYIEIWNWMTGMGFPDTFEQHKNLVNSPRGDDSGLYSDGSLIIMNSQKLPNYEIKFKDMFPIALNDLSFDVTNTDVEYISCDATFTYQSYEIRKIDNP